MPPSSDPVLIAGAGIGGLTLAKALAKRGIASLVLERESRLEEVGAGIQLSPNASHVLLNLGLDHALREVASEPRHVRVSSGRSGKRLAELPLAGTMRQRYGAPFLVVHRADLQQVLFEAVRGEPLVTLQQGAAVVAFEQDGACVHAATAGSSHTGRALVGADGLYSVVRRTLVGDGAPAFSGFVAWRGLGDAKLFDADLLHATGLWLAPGAHLVHYPVRGGRMLNVVAIVQEAQGASGRSTSAELAQHFSGWCAAARDLVARIVTWHRWPLFDRPPLARWSDARVTLLGDAAHPMLPFIAQGGAMAIEDAAILAASLDGSPDVPAAIATYETQRRSRTARAQLEARANGRIYHLPGYLAPIRDMVISAQSSRRMAERQDWIYSWQAGN